MCIYYLGSLHIVSFYRYKCSEGNMAFKNDIRQFISIEVSYCLSNKEWSLTSINPCEGILR